MICCGGGGIPVIRKNRKFRGVEAVIDKDLASSILAQEIKADIFVIASDVEGAAINWGQTDQKMLRKTPLAEMDNIRQRGAIPGRLHGPQGRCDDAVFQSHRQPGRHLSAESDIEKAIAGEAGTEITK